MTRVLVADDHPVVRSGLVALLGSLDGFEVVGTAATGEEAVRETLLSSPDVVLMDLHMPGAGGLAAIAALRSRAPHVAVCVLTMFDDDDSLVAALRAGARGYVLKGAEQEELARAVRAVAAGEVLFGPGVAAAVLGHLAAPPERVAEPFPSLTAREREVLDLLAAGLPTTAIAGRLGVSRKTVSNHLSALLVKLEVPDRTSAVLAARAAGLGRPDG